MDTIKKQELLDEIIGIEWDMFQHTNNIGGRASCQDDPETFYIMRAAQYANWTGAMLECWAGFIKQCEQEGRNLVAEKYGGKCTWDELGLPVTETGLALPCGATGRWFSE